MPADIVDASEERFWKDLEPLIFDEERLQNAPEECRRVINMLAIGNHSRILDIGCGVGRHSNHLASLGYHVEGIDKIPHLIARARQTSTAENSPVFHVGDVARYADYSVDRFDHAICFYHSLGFNPDPADDLEILKRVGRLLRPGGRLFIELIDPDGYEPGQCLTFETPIEGQIYIEEIRISEDRRIYELTIRERGAHETVFRARHRLFFQSDILGMLQAAGFHVSWPGGDALTNYTSTSKKFCLLAEVPRTERSL